MLEIFYKFTRNSFKQKKTKQNRFVQKLFIVNICSGQLNKETSIKKLATQHKKGTVAKIQQIVLKALFA